MDINMAIWRPIVNASYHCSIHIIESILDQGLQYPLNSLSVSVFEGYILMPVFAYEIESCFAQLLEISLAHNLHTKCVLTLRYSKMSSNNPGTEESGLRLVSSTSCSVRAATTGFKVWRHVRDVGTDMSGETWFPDLTRKYTGGSSRVAFPDSRAT